jgi:hypothetical protein
MFFVARDATSAISFLIPAIEIVSIGEVLCMCWRSASAWHRCPPMGELDEATSLVAQATAGVLSQKIPTCECCRQIGLMFSRTSQARKTPAISRFEIFIGLHLFAAETRFALISAGHS